VGEQIKRDGMGSACGTYGGEEKYIGLWCGNLKERYNWHDLGVDGIIILKWL
jgi:hypothetical protein